MKNKCETCETMFVPKRGSAGRFCRHECYWESLKGKQPKDTHGLKKGWGWNKGVFKNKVKYNSIHRWVQRNFDRPDKCKMCGEQNSHFEWANKNGKYRRNREDWINLCASCHRYFDRKNKFQVNFEGGKY